MLKKTKLFAGRPTPFVMELPAYHFPAIRSWALHVWERCWAFIKKAGTVIFASTVVVWFLSNLVAITVPLASCLLWTASPRSSWTTPCSHAGQPGCLDLRSARL